MKIIYLRREIIKQKTVKMPHKVKFNEFNPARLVFGKIDEKTTNQNGQQIKYYIIPMQYMYEVTTVTGEKRDVKDNLYIEVPKIKSRGPQNKVYEDKNRSVWSVYTRFDLSDPDQQAFVNTSKETPGTMHSLAMKCCEFAFNNKKDLNLKCSSLDSMVDLMHYPIRWPDNDLSSSDNPGAVFKLMCYGKDPSNLKKTTFTLPIGGGKTIPWETIMESNIIHEPLLKFDNMTIASGRPSIKFEMVSSIIHDILPAAGENMQKDTLENAAKNINTEALEARVRELEARLASVGSGKEQLANAVAPTPAVVPSSAAEIPGLNNIGIPGLSTSTVPAMSVASAVPAMSVASAVPAMSVASAVPAMSVASAVPAMPAPEPAVPSLPTMESILNAAPAVSSLPAMPVAPAIPGLPPTPLPGLPGLPALP